MPQYTENYSYAEPQYGEQADIEVLNQYVTRKVDENMYQTRRMMVDGFDDTKSYTTGDLVEYSNAIYRFIADKASGAWDSTKVELTTIADELATKGEGGADVTKTASGNPIEITDGANAPLVKCVTAIQGNQDLHGYDKPWVGGAGKNKLPLLLSKIKTFNTAGTWTGNTYVLNGITYVFQSYDNETITGVNISSNGATGRSVIYYYRDDNAPIVQSQTVTFSGIGGFNRCAYQDSTTWHESTQAYFTATITNGITQIWCELLEGWSGSFTSAPQVEIGSSPTTFAPYSNICPITAYNQSTISVGGKNLANFVDGYSVNPDGNVVTYTNRCATVDPIIINPNLTYVVTNYGAQCFFIYAVFNGSTLIRRESGITKNSILNTSGGDKLYVCAYDSTVSNIKPMVIDTIATAYEPYNPNSATHTATFSQSIYQGNADFVGGEVNTNKVVITLNTANMNNNYDSYPGWKGCGIKDVIGADKRLDITNGILNIGSIYRINTTGSNDLIYFNRSDYNLTQTEWIALAMDVQIVVELPTPTTSSITPTNLPIKSLFGYNHIESSTGDMEVEYITEGYQPLVDLIESNSGKVTQDILYTASTMSETEIDVDLTAYDEYIIFANDVLVTTQIPQGSTFPRITFDVAITNNSSIVIYGYDDCSCIYTVSSNKLTYNSGRGGYRITMIIGVKVGDVSTSQTLNRSLRSLNLTKSAVEEIPDEIKNAEYEEKPDVNEAEDDAPTEEKR